MKLTFKVIQGQRSTLGQIVEMLRFDRNDPDYDGVTMGFAFRAVL